MVNIYLVVKLLNSNKYQLISNSSLIILYSFIYQLSIVINLLNCLEKFASVFGLMFIWFINKKYYESHFIH